MATPSAAPKSIARLTRAEYLTESRNLLLRKFTDLVTCDDRCADRVVDRTASTKQP